MGSCISSKQYQANGTKSLEVDLPSSYYVNSNDAVVVGGVWSSTPRMNCLAIDALPDKVRASLDRLPADSFKNKYAPVNVIGTIAKSPEVAASFLDHWVSSKKLMSLTNREQELIILRMAVHYRSEYVWKHHVVIGSEFGITKIECDILQQKPRSTTTTTTPDTFTDRENALIELTDDMVITRTISNSTWQRCSPFFEESELIDIILVISHYVFFSLVNNSLCVDVEPALNDVPGLKINSAG
jgi:4-carboxymuconolactone decarboxylase